MPARLYIQAKKRAGWTPKSPGNLLGWWDFSDITTLFTDSGLGTQSVNGGVIGAITDKSGLGNTATQATAAQKPTRADNSQNGKAGGAFVSTGSGTQLATGAFSVAQPCTIVVWTTNIGSSSGYIIDGGSVNERILLFNAGNASIYSGTFLNGAAANNLSASMLLGLFNSTNSIVRYNGSETTGDAGTAADTDGITIGGQGNQAAGCSGTILEVACWSNDIGANHRQNAQIYGQIKYGMP